MPHWWIQADCVLIEARDIQDAYGVYREQLAQAEIGCSQGEHCCALRALKLTNPEKHAALLAQQDGDW